MGPGSPAIVHNTQPRPLHAAYRYNLCVYILQLLRRPVENPYRKKRPQLVRCSCQQRCSSRLYPYQKVDLFVFLQIETAVPAEVLFNVQAKQGRYLLRVFSFKIPDVCCLLRLASMGCRNGASMLSGVCELGQMVLLRRPKVHVLHGTCVRSDEAVCGTITAY